MAEDKLEVREASKPTRRAVLKGVLVGLGASVLVQSAGGVVGFGAQEKGTDQKIEHKNEMKSEKMKIEKGKLEKTTKKDSKSKSEKKKMEEPKAQHKR